MKLKSFYLLMIALAAVLMSCSKDDDGIDAAKLVGKWSLETEVYSVKVAGVSYGYTYTGSEDDYLELLADGTVTMVQDGQDLTGTYSISGKQITLNYPEAGTTPTMTVTTLTSNQLVLYYKNYTDANNYVEETLTFSK